MLLTRQVDLKVGPEKYRWFPHITSAAHCFGVENPDVRTSFLMTSKWMDRITLQIDLWEQDMSKSQEGIHEQPRGET